MNISEVLVFLLFAIASPVGALEVLSFPTPVPLSSNGNGYYGTTARFCPPISSQHGSVRFLVVGGGGGIISSEPPPAVVALRIERPACPLDRGSATSRRSGGAFAEGTRATVGPHPVRRVMSARSSAVESCSTAGPRRPPTTPVFNTAGRGPAELPVLQ